MTSNGTAISQKVNSGYKHLLFGLISQESAFIMEFCNHLPKAILSVDLLKSMGVMIRPAVEMVIVQKVPHLQAFIGEVVECKNQQIG